MFVWGNLEEVSLHCCTAHCQATDAKFGRKTALADLARYQRRGPDPTTSDIIRAIRRISLEGGSLLDIGGGIGVIQRELLGAVFSQATLVEASSAYLDVAQSDTESAGSDGKARYVHGDFSDVADELSPADVVTLDRVVCCYPDYVRLLSAAAAKTILACVVSYPRDRWFVKLVFFLNNLSRWVTGDKFRTFVHANGEMDNLLRTAGLELHDAGGGLVWRVVVCHRGDNGSTSYPGSS